VAAAVLLLTALATASCGLVGALSGKFYNQANTAEYIEFLPGNAAKLVTVGADSIDAVQGEYVRKGNTLTVIPSGGADGNSRTFKMTSFGNIFTSEFGDQYKKTPLFDVSLVFTRIPPVLKYLPVTMEIAVLAMLFSLIIAFLVAIIKVKRIPVLRTIASIYVSFTRGTPILIQLYATYFGIPMALKALNVETGFINSIPPIVFSLVALALNDAAYSSEAIRAAIQAVDRGQIEAASSIGMSAWQSLRRIIIPESLVIALPSLGNAFIGMIKGTSLVFTTAVVEMTARGRQLSQFDYRYFEMYVTLAIIYWIITLVVSKLLDLWEWRLKCDERAAGGGAGRDTVARLTEKV
jgi:polar amino acid transport system permease protein